MFLSQFPLKVSSPAKINLHLEILGRRPDGFHELAMVMQSIDLSDTLFFQHTTEDTINLTCNYSELPTNNTNLIIRAAELLKSHSKLFELGAIIYLNKRIPIGAGLAGGSSNGAAALVGLNRLWNLGYSPDQLMSFAAELGSDMPFTMKGGTLICFGRGEKVEPAPYTNSVRIGMAVLVIKDPTLSISTPWAFNRYMELYSGDYLTRELDFSKRRQFLRESRLIAALSKSNLFPPIQNDLQKVLESSHTSINEGLELLKTANQNLAVAMSGSGPSLFALFQTLELAQLAQYKLAESFKRQGYESWCSALLPNGICIEEANDNE
uniref:4-(cytidine 5'-diphospho)-2-C-methyl-D-erythritol kinase n=1 Tax=Paulinella chromatophora TaxID=39717 RepID=B1X421_PAUCH|nr:Putative 4-diphosphocytidyl -2C-methyl-D- erythritol kinase (CMK) [Paulinella chromatophora]ACB42690.1 Putative 4-diphosphocytidyl -2C-methyl-D- erythritol kinase (CMK) [Paulinella chromatophora]